MMSPLTFLDNFQFFLQSPIFLCVHAYFCQNGSHCNIKSLSGFHAWGNLAAFIVADAVLIWSMPSGTLYCPAPIWGVALQACFTVVTQKWPITVIWHLSLSLEFISRTPRLLFSWFHPCFRKEPVWLLPEENIDNLLAWKYPKYFFTWDCLIRYRALTSRGFPSECPHYCVALGDAVEKCCANWFPFLGMWSAVFPGKLLGNVLYPWCLGISFHSALGWDFKNGF